MRINIRAILGNLALLSVSLILAIIIWVTAVQANDPISVINAVQVPVDVIGRRSDISISNTIPETVQISIEGPATVLNTLDLEQIRAVVDLSQLPFGESQVNITVPYRAEGVRISEPFPSRVTVTLEQIVTRNIPVTVNVRGSVARGYVREDPLVEPDVIEVTGPASRVDQLAQAQVTIFLDNARETIKVTPPLIFRDQSGRVASVSGLTLSEDEVQVTVPIDELAGFAEKPVTARWTGEPAPGYRLLNVSVEPNSVLVTGRSIDLESLERLRTEEINIEGLNQSLTLQVGLDLPAGITLPEDEVQTVTVQVEIEPILTVGAVLKQPELLGLGEGLTAILEPDEIRVFLFGPLPILDGLQDADVRVTLDLFSLTEGVYNVEPVVETPYEEVEIRSWIPAFFMVEITRVVTTTSELSPTSWQFTLPPAPDPSTAGGPGTIPSAAAPFIMWPSGAGLVAEPWGNRLPA